MTDRPLVKRMDSIKDATVEDVVNWCLERGMAVNEVTVTYSHLVWYSPRSDEEQQRYDEYTANNAARTEAWERATLVRLQEKYQ